MKEPPSSPHPICVYLLVLALCACQPAAPQLLSPSPSRLPSPTLSSSPTGTFTPTLTPSPVPSATTPAAAATATPRTHVVKKGEDFGGIAYTYGITLKALVAANPKVDPNLIRVGTVLVIPSPTNPAAQATPAPILPTAVAVQLSQPTCYTTLDGSLDCMALVSNPLTLFVESVSVVFHLVDQDTGAVVSKTATTPLNLVPAGWAMPVHIVIPAPIPQHYQAGIDLANALPYSASDQRYINVRVENRKDAIAADGLSAVLEGDLILEGDSQNRASVTWAAAAAFDLQNRVVGLRRWESAAALVGGQPTHFMLTVYSAGPVINHLTLLAEARR